MSQNAAAKKSEARAKGPDIFVYHDHREYLRDQFAHLRKSDPKFSMASLAKEAGIAKSYLSMILNGTRTLTEDTQEKLLKKLRLNSSEKSYFRLIRILGESDSHEERLEVLKKIQKFFRYRESNQQEIETYQYLTKWHLVAIREMADLKDFKEDPAWIQKKLRSHVPLQEIKESLDFLIRNGYIERSSEGEFSVQDRPIRCKGGVYRIALCQFHEQMLELERDSIRHTPSDERNINAFTVALSPAEYESIVKVLKSAREKVIDLSSSKSAKDKVYHITFGAFPVTFSSAAEAAKKKKEDKAS